MKLRSTETSKSVNAGPSSTSRPSLPNCPACVTGFKRWNADGLTHCWMVCGPALGFAIRFGRLAGIPEMGGLLAWSETLVESYTVYGDGELCVPMMLNCHPFKMCRSAG